MATKLRVVASDVVSGESVQGDMEPLQSLRDYGYGQQVPRTIQAALIVYMRQRKIDPWGHYPLASWCEWHADLLRQPVT